MKYGLLLWPHANARYQSEIIPLAKAELEATLRATVGAEIMADLAQDAPMLTFDSDSLTDDTIHRISLNSMAYALFEMDNGLLKPLAWRAQPYLGSDLAGILKYKGKTNELFTLFTIELALYSSKYWQKMGERLEFYDPMCARGTSLFQAVNLGWNATGSDIDKTDIHELNQFFKRYLEYHKFKHSTENGSATMKDGHAPWTRFDFAATPAEYKAGEIHTLRTALCDCALTDYALGKNQFHIMACDLPYGVQHAPGGCDLEGLLKKSLPHWKNSLKNGGAIAISYNTNVLKRNKLREIVSQSGLTVLEGGLYDTLEHWVEQAVSRDVVIARRDQSK